MKKYQKDAQNRYNLKFDIVQARLPKGTKERIQSLDYNINAFIVEAVETMLKSLETPTAPILEPTESVSTEKETKEVDQMPSAEVMPWEEGFVDPLSESEEEKRKEKIAKFLARKHGDAINDVIIQESIRSDYGMDMLIKANWYVEHQEALEEPDQESKPEEKGIQSLEELNCFLQAFFA
ncbi:MAG: hypothetical protein SOR66_04895 [Mediterraneibacter faecis]|nr:hypothetical protein [Mediterraneibacter faecis]